LECMGHLCALAGGSRAASRHQEADVHKIMISRQ
jgi:hypothetical protein